MTTTVTPPARTLRPPRKARSNGQWALDGRKPLNDNEAFKQDGDPLAVRDRIMHIYGPGGYETIAPDDLNGRFRWWGLYTQRKQGIDGGRTAQLDVSELSDHYFLQRVRLDGGSLSREYWARSPTTSPAAPPTSPIARTSSSTGWRSAACLSCGSAWSRWV